MNPDKYIDPTVNRGFKIIFGKETNKDVLISFLNAIFRGQKNIKDLTMIRGNSLNGTSFFDLTCVTSSGELFAFEVQRRPHKNFRKRIFYHGCKLVADQFSDLDIREVYVIVIMEGFKMPDMEDDSKYLHHLGLAETDSNIKFPLNFEFIFLELENFNKEAEDLKDDLDGWLYLFKHLNSWGKAPAYLRKPIFEKALKTAEYCSLSEKENALYELSLKQIWDENVILDYAHEEGEKKGQKKGEKIGKEKSEKRIIENLLTKDYPVSEIASIVGVSVEYIEEIHRQLKEN